MIERRRDGIHLSNTLKSSGLLTSKENMALQTELPQAPRLHFRRPAHFTRLGALIFSVIILFYFLYKVVPIWAVVWGVINLLAWLLELFNTLNGNSTLQLEESPTFYRRHYLRLPFFLIVVLINLGILLALTTSPLRSAHRPEYAPLPYSFQRAWTGR